MNNSYKHGKIFGFNEHKSGYQTNDFVCAYFSGVMYIYLLGLAFSNLCVLIVAIPALMSLTATEW